MNNNKIKNKTKILAFTMASFMATSSFGLAINGLVKSKLVRDTIEAYTSELSISDSNFTNTTISSSTNLPAAPSSWTEIQKPENVTAGVITLDTSIATTDKITNSYKLSGDLPNDTNLDDKQVLMLNASTGSAVAGYKSSELTLSSRSYYIIKFKAYCDSSSFGSARISGDNELENADTTLSISTNGVWQEYKFFVKTSSINSVTANLELWLGNVKEQNKSSGAIFFDDVSAASYDNATFELALQNSQAANEKYKLINLDREYLTSGPKNSSFESALSESDWTLSEENTLHSASETISGRFDVENHNSVDTGITDEVKNSNVYGNRYALLINNKESGSVGYKSSYFTIKSKELYKLSFIAKTGSLENGATVKLIERNPYTNQKLSDGVTANPYYYNNSSYEARTFTMSDIKTADYTNEYTNGWKEYSFFIKGHSLIDTEVNLELWLGTSDSAEKGYVFFDEFKMQKLTSSEYENNSSSATVANLSQDTKETDIKNAAFNLVEISEVDDSYPYVPSNWTLESQVSTGVLNGVINTANDNFALGVPVIPALDPSYPNNNVLMIGNVASNNQKYVSSELTLSADSYSKITVKVLTTELSGAKAGLRVVSGDIVLGEIMNIDTNTAWKTYTIFIKTGYEEKAINLELSLGENTEGTGFAFFDNVLYSSSLSAEDFAEQSADKKIDLVKNDWSNLPAKSTSTQGLYKPYGWTEEYSDETDVGAITSGVIDTTKYGDTEVGYYESSFESPEHPEGEGSKVLMIKATNDSYYTYKTATTAALSSDSYYKISVYVKTDGIGQNEENVVYKDSRNSSAYPYGATINIDGIEATFTGINTEGQWKLYTMYINSTTDSEISLELSLGSENAKTHGAVYFSSTSIEKIEQEEYVEGVKDLENSSIDNVLAVGDTNVKSEDEEENKNDNGEISFNWLLVPSIITGIAILVAVIGVIWRNYRKKSHKKPKIQKPYSKENYKKLAEQHKVELGQLKEQKSKLVAKHNSVAVELNKAKAENSENAEKLEKEYAELSKKIEQVEEKKKEAIKKYKQKVNDLKAMEKAEKKWLKKLRNATFFYVKNLFW